LLPYPFAAALRCWAMSSSTPLPRSLQTGWHGFLETYEPLRPDLYRYCRHLTRSPWDAEDLAQDTLARAFVTLAQLGDSPPNPRAWLFRVASNLWIDRLRRVRNERTWSEEPVGDAPNERDAREAAGTLLSRLPPQERAAVVLKDVFNFSLEEISESLSTSVGAVKTALHRARGKLSEPAAEPARQSTPTPAALTAFCAAFNAGDLERLTALLLDSACVEVVGATTRYGQEEARRTVLWGMLFGVKIMVAPPENFGIAAELLSGVLPSAPRVEARLHRDSWLLLHWYRHDTGEAVRAITRVETVGDRVAHLQNYFYSPELLAEVCAELSLPARHNGRRWWPRVP
jgi:RNA polymerase sigma-70 factor (ECF subfamily)